MIKSFLEVEWDTCGSREEKQQNGEMKDKSFEDLEKMMKEVTTISSVMNVKEKDDISSAEKERKSKKELDWKTIPQATVTHSSDDALKPIDELINTTFTCTRGAATLDLHGCRI